jgi:hypothetical protein
VTLHEIRIELLKLTYTHGRDAAEAVSRTRELEKFVVENAPPATRDILHVPKKDGR